MMFVVKIVVGCDVQAVAKIGKLVLRLGVAVLLQPKRTCAGSVTAAACTITVSPEIVAEAST